MIERAIENWLINTNERNYQIPFCQALISKGFEVLYISPHGQLEFGKDIIAKSPEGEVFAYQLKGGDITLKGYRAILGELYQLIDSKCDHPNVDKAIPHRSVLVSNGKIKDDVLQAIIKLNQTEVHYSKLETMDISQILKYFLEAQGEFIPKSFDEFQEFLSFFQLNGNEFFPKKKFFIFIKNQILQTAKQKSDKLNSIFASVILTSYILKNFQEKKNSFAQFEAWTILYSTLIGFVKEENLLDKKIDASFRLINRIILDCLEDLTKEFVDKDNLIEGSAFGDGDLIYKARTTIVLGLVCCNKGYYNPNFDEQLHSKIIENLKYLWFWGESSFPYLFFIIKYLERNKLIDQSLQIMNALLEEILKHNDFWNKEQAFPNPYYDIDAILESTFCNIPLDFKQFKANSYIFNPLVEMMGRRGIRAPLEKNWRKISHMQISKFITDRDYEYFYFWNKNGINYSNFPKQTESWKDLQDYSKNKSSSDLLKKNKEFLPLFFLVYPHRISEELVKCIDI